MIGLVRNKRNFSKNLKTKIVATIGPASQDVKTLRAMIKQGVTVARLNFSHGSHENHLEVINRIRKLSKQDNKPIAILQDLAGPKIRLDHMPKPVHLKKNTLIKLSVERDQEADLFTSFSELPQYIRPGDTILLDDGNIELETIAVEASSLTCKVTVPGIATSRKGINLPDISIPLPVFRPKDQQDLAFGLEQPIDLVALSFVESGEDAYPLRAMMEKMSKNLPLIAKIERPKALGNINNILNTFDGIMIARGDLGVEISPEEVPVIQKKLIKLANLKNKIVITATQMLESMIQNPRPTRAEASDVSNAILDGTDAVMLSGETAIGKHPVKSVGMMKRIALATENSKLYHYSLILEKEKIDNTEAIVKSATMIAKDLKAKYILVFTQSGNTALLISKYRPNCPILAFSPNKKVVSNMASYWGVLPHWLEFTPHTDDMIHMGELLVKEEQLVKSGDLIITVAGITPMKGATNMLRISRIP